MSDKSAIEWTDATWNPTTGCTKISPGCAHCYIERTPAFRIAGNRFVDGKTDISIFHDRLEQPLHWRKPRRVFVNSLSDLFHEDISDAFIDRVFAVMALAPQHTFQVLTKRPGRMQHYFRLLEDSNGLTREERVAQAADWMREQVGVNAPNGYEVSAKFSRAAAALASFTWPLPNVWLGGSVENQHFADERIPLLLQTPAAVRFISAEPLLEAIDIRRWLMPARCISTGVPMRRVPEMDLPGLDWVIVGGESGPGARPFDVAWARSIVSQCKAAGVPVFVKQLGAAAYGPDIHSAILRDRKGGDPAEWPEDLRVRQFPASGEPARPLAAGGRR